MPKLKGPWGPSRHKSRNLTTHIEVLNARYENARNVITSVNGQFN